MIFFHINVSITSIYQVCSHCPILSMLHSSLIDWKVHFVMDLIIIILIYMKLYYFVILTVEISFWYAVKIGASLILACSNLLLTESSLSSALPDVLPLLLSLSMMTSSGASRYRILFGGLAWKMVIKITTNLISCVFSSWVLKTRPLFRYNIIGTYLPIIPKLTCI